MYILCGVILIILGIFLSSLYSILFLIIGMISLLIGTFFVFREIISLLRIDKRTYFSVYNLCKGTFVEVGIIFFLILGLSTGIIYGFTNQERTIKICEREYNNKDETVGKPLDINFSKNSNNTFNVAFKKEKKVKLSYSLDTHVSYYCNNVDLKITKITIYSFIGAIILIAVDFLVFRRIPFVDINRDYNEYF